MTVRKQTVRATAQTRGRNAELREDFEHFDQDGDGLLQVDEFVRFLDGVGAEMTDEECRLGFVEIDSDRDGVIDFGEFLDWWKSR